MSVVIRTELAHAGAGETAANARFREAHARGVRRWVDNDDGEILEVVELLEACGIPCVRVKDQADRVLGYTMRSSHRWRPIEPDAPPARAKAG